MKILVICQFYYPEQFRINDICESLVKEGNEVTVLTGLPNYPKGLVPKEYKFFKKRKETINNVNVIRCFEIGRRKGKIFRVLNYISYMVSASFRAIFLKKDFDSIFIYQLSPITMAVPGIVYKKIHKNKKIHLYCLDLWPESLLAENFSQDGRIYKIIKKLSKWIYNKCDDILVTSKEFTNYFKEELAIDKEIKYVPQYAESIYEIKGDVNDDKKDGTTNFVFAGNIGKAQSVETIIKAAAKLKSEDIMIHIVGDGSALESCKELAEQLELNNIIFYGRKPIEEMKQYYKMADAMLITLSDNEIISKTLPGKVQSYMMAKKPIIGTIGGATKEVINEAQCGYCAEPENEDQLADCMKQFINNTKEEKKQMSENAYKYYQLNFKKDKIIKNLVEILREDTKNV